MSPFVIILFLIGLGITAALIWLLMQVHRCPPDKAMLVFNRNGAEPEVLIQSGSIIILPWQHDVALLDLKPLHISLSTRAKSIDEASLRINARYIMQVSTDENRLRSAARHLINLNKSQLSELAKDVIRSSSKDIIGRMPKQQIDAFDDRFTRHYASELQAPLNRLGIDLINIDVNEVVVI